MARVRRLLGRAALVLATALVALVLLELGVRAVLPSGPDGAEAGTDAGQQGPGVAALLNRVHPFLGWSRAPGAPSPVIFWRGDIPIGPTPGADLGPWTRANATANAYGYFSWVEDYATVPADRFVVGIFGGSVADQLTVLAGDTLRDALSERLALAPESIVVLNLGSGAYKQPQQLISLLQLVLLGVDLDLVVNVDGFNEVVFGTKDARAGDHPIFPSRGHWAATVELARALPSEEQLERAGRIAGLRVRARAVAALTAEGHLLHHSALARAASGAIATRLLERAQALEAELQAGAAGPEASPIATLPDPCLQRRDGCWRLVADLWERSSVLMHELARRSGAAYVHALQPAIDVADGKPLSEEERASRHNPTRQVRAIRAGYPRLRERGVALGQRGVAFLDLSLAFAEHPETLYVDGCCHFNVRGNRILAREIAAFAAEQLARGAGDGGDGASPIPQVDAPDGP